MFEEPNNQNTYKSVLSLCFVAFTSNDDALSKTVFQHFVCYQLTSNQHTVTQNSALNNFDDLTIFFNGKRLMGFYFNTQHVIYS